MGQAEHMPWMEPQNHDGPWTQVGSFAGNWNQQQSYEYGPRRLCSLTAGTSKNKFENLTVTETIIDETIKERNWQVRLIDIQKAKADKLAKR